MPKYFIDSFDGAHDLADDEGHELANDTVARAAALDALADMVRDILPDGDHRIFSVMVRTAEGTELYQARITLDGSWINAVPG